MVLVGASNDKDEGERWWQTGRKLNESLLQGSEEGIEYCIAFHSFGVDR